MSKIITFSNHKGGVGKTTSVANIGAGLYKLGKKVLLVDLDPQANLTQSLNIKDISNNSYGAIKQDYPPTPVSVITGEEGFDIIPSTLDLSGAELELSSQPGREFALKDVLDQLNHKKYDFILIDSPPSLGLLTLNAYTASDYIFIPLQAEFLAMQGFSKLIEVIEKIQKRLNKNLKLGGIFITQYDSRKVLNRNVSDAIEDRFKDTLLNTKIRDNVALAEAPAMGVDIFRYAPKSKGSVDYLSLTEEILTVV